MPVHRKPARSVDEEEGPRSPCQMSRVDPSERGRGCQCAMRRAPRRRCQMSRVDPSATAPPSGGRAPDGFQDRKPSDGAIRPTIPAAQPKQQIGKGRVHFTERYGFLAQILQPAGGDSGQYARTDSGTDRRVPAGRVKNRKKAMGRRWIRVKGVAVAPSAGQGSSTTTSSMSGIPSIVTLFWPKPEPNLKINECIVKSRPSILKSPSELIS